MFFTRYPYQERYAIVGKAKELRRCFGWNFTSALLLKDGHPYPWPRPKRRERFRWSILHDRNRSLMLMDISDREEGDYECEASNDVEVIFFRNVASRLRSNLQNPSFPLVEHATTLRGFSTPSFQHPPTQKEKPQDRISLVEGAKSILNVRLPQVLDTTVSGTILLEPRENHQTYVNSFQTGLLLSDRERE